MFKKKFKDFMFAKALSMVTMILLFTDFSFQNFSGFRTNKS